jgi:hypothetical protein
MERETGIDVDRLDLSGVDRIDALIDYAIAKTAPRRRVIHKKRPFAPWGGLLPTMCGKRVRPFAAVCSSQFVTCAECLEK